MEKIEWDRKKVSIGLCGIGGLLDIIFGFFTFNGIGFICCMDFGTLVFLRSLILIVIISGIPTIIGSLIESKNLRTGSLLCLIIGILTLVIAVVLFILMAFFFLTSLLLLPPIFIIIGGRLGILEHKKTEKI